MSYAVLGALGAPDPNVVRPPECGAMQKSGGLSYCVGYEQSCPSPERCCPPETWFMRVYREIMGKHSARALAEQRVRQAEALLLLKLSRDAETGIERFAYDHDAIVPDGLIDRIGQSFALFRAAFPSARWRWDPTDVHAELECSEEGLENPGVTYGGWDENRTYYPDARVQAFSVLAGERFSPAFVQKLRAEGLQVPPGPFYQQRPGRDPWPGAVPSAQLQRALDRAASAIESIPGARPDDIVDPTFVFEGEPGRSVRRPTMEDLLTVLPNRQLVPSAWLQQFLLALAPKAMAIPAPRVPTPSLVPRVEDITPPKYVVPGATLVPMEPGRIIPRGAAAPPPGVDEAKARPLLLAAGALVVGVGTYVFVRMARW